MEICCVPNCKAEATTITDKHGIPVCGKCLQHFSGTVAPTFRQRLKNLLDNGKLRG